MSNHDARLERTMAMHDLRFERMDAVNRLIEEIAARGRNFFRGSDEFVSRFDMIPTARSEFTLVFWDRYMPRRGYRTPLQVHFISRNNMFQRGFSEGGTLRALCIAFRDYIVDGWKLSPTYFGPWPQWICEGDLWGYGEDMEIIRAKANELGITKGEK